MAKDRNPNTSYPSRSHESEGHPYRHIDEYHYGSDGKLESETHGIEVPDEIADEIDAEHDAERDSSNDNDSSSSK